MFRITLLICSVAAFFAFTSISGKEVRSTVANKPYVTKTLSKQDGKCLIDKNSDSCVSIEISYPVFSSALGDLSTKQLNQYIQNKLIIYNTFDNSTVTGAIAFADKFLADYLSQTQDDSRLSGNWERSKEVRVTFSNQHVLTLHDKEDGYTGGAHGFSNTNLVSLNLKTRKPFKLDDILLKASKKKLLILGEQYFRKLHNLPEQSSLEKEGFEFKRNRFSLSSNFAILKDGLLFYYNSYDIAAYARGPTELFIPYNRLSGLIDMDIIGL